MPDATSTVIPINRGHNQPPEPIIETEAELRIRVEREHAAILDKLRDQEIGLGRLPTIIDSPAVAGQVNDFLAQCNGVLEEAKTIHAKVKAPYLSLTRAVDNIFLRRIEKFTNSKGSGWLDAIKRKLAAYQKQVRETARDKQRAEQAEAVRLARVRAEEAERLRVEAAKQPPTNRGAAKELVRQAEIAEAGALQAQAIADAPPVQAIVRGELGSAGYLRDSYELEVYDPELIPSGFLVFDEATAREVIDEAIAAGKEPPEIPGVRRVPTSTYVVRRP